MHNQEALGLPWFPQKILGGNVAMAIGVFVFKIILQSSSQISEG